MPLWRRKPRARTERTPDDRTPDDRTLDDRTPDDRTPDLMNVLGDLPVSPHADNPNVRRREAMERAGRPLPDDPAVAELVAGIRDRYRVGGGPWDACAANARHDLAAAGEPGLRAAAWIVARMVADLRWELGFWTEEAGLPTAPDARAGFAQISHGHPNPYDTLSGLHPRIHLVAAAELLTEHPRAEVAGPLADLLELWFAHAEQQYHLRDLGILVLETLVRCYRATPATAHPAYLVELAGQDVTRPVVNVGQAVSHVAEDVTYVDPVFRDDGTVDLSALARAATSR